MGGIISSIASSLTLCLGYCACQSASSLCEACFGYSDPSSTGRKRSILLLAMTVALALYFQYSFAPSIQDGNSVLKIPYIGTRIKNAWNDQCLALFQNDADLLLKCQGHAGVYRATFVSSLFFACMAIATKFNSAINRSAWPAKYTLFLILVFGTMFLYNSPLFFGPFIFLSRIGATLFLIMQQIILIDLAYAWNETWVENSVNADSIDYGSGSKWLIAIVLAIVVLYSGCLVAFILLFQNFTGCPTNTALIWVTLLLIVGITTIQLNSEGGNLLTSAVLSTYAVYLLISAVSHNPNAECNPFIGDSGSFEIVIGLFLTFLSLVWTGWSWTDERILTTTGMKENPNPPSSSPANDRMRRPLDGLDIPMLEEQSNYVGGVVMDSAGDEATMMMENNDEMWKLNVVLMLVSCWITVSLTGWGTVRVQEEILNEWLIIISQWVALGLYAWTLAAPMLFPDRDFS